MLSGGKKCPSITKPSKFDRPKCPIQEFLHGFGILSLQRSIQLGKIKSPTPNKLTEHDETCRIPQSYPFRERTCPPTRRGAQPGSPVGQSRWGGRVPSYTGGYGGWSFYEVRREPQRCAKEISKLGLPDRLNARQAGISPFRT